MQRIAITNMAGARNRGCEALVQSIVSELLAEGGGSPLRISLHTGDEVYDREQFSAGIDAVYSTSNLPPPRLTPGQQRAYFGVAKWLNKTPLRRFLPSSTLDSLNADLIIATGGDNFSSDYGGFPRHARTLQVGTPVALLAQTIGPFKDSDARLFKASTGNIVLCTVRETETLHYINEIAPELHPELTADVAFLLPVTPPEVARDIVEVDNRFALKGRRLLGLSVSAGILSYRGDVDSAHYLQEIVAFIDELNTQGWSVLLIPHVQERWRRNNDVYVCREVFRRIKLQNENAVLYSPMSASDFKGVIGLCEVLVGARTHTTIASMSQGIPTVSIAYSRKAWGIMRDYYGEALAHATTIDVADLDRERLKEAVDRALANGRTDAIAQEKRRLAAVNFLRVREYLAARAAKDTPKRSSAANLLRSSAG